MDKMLEHLLSETARLAEEGGNCEYEAFVQLVELRQQMLDLLEQYQEPLPEEYKQKLRLLAEKDAVILEHMQRLKKEAEEGLARLTQIGRAHV